MVITKNKWSWKSFTILHAVLYCMGMRIVQADSVSDSDSESRNNNEEIIPVNRLNQTVCTDRPAPATTIPTRTVKQRTFFAPTGDDSLNRSRNLNLPAMLTGANSQNQSQNLNLPALLTGADSQNQSRNLNLPPLYTYPMTRSNHTTYCSGFLWFGYPQ
jgi:hypothetical protein